MDHDNATLLQENLLKITETQNKIRNKYEKACKNRIENEHAEKQTMEPLAAFAISTTAAEKDKSQITEKADHSTVNSVSKKNYKAKMKKKKKKNKEEKIDPNILCARLSTLITDEIRNNANHKREKNSILKKLRELNIIC